MSNNQMKCGVIGFGAFGKFMSKHLAPHMVLSVYDVNADTSKTTGIENTHFAPLENVCACDIVIFAAPVQVMRETLATITPFLNPNCLFIDVCSVKIKPVALMKEGLPEKVDIIGLHPLFGPQSGRDGIEGLNVTLCDVRSNRAKCVKLFLEEKLNLTVIEATPEQHDKDMSYTMGLTHMMAKLFAMIDVSETKQTTKTYELLCEMVSMIKDDSDDLFLAIQEENPYMEATKNELFTAVKKLKKRLERE